MATYEDAMIALRNADKAGDVAAARSLAVIAQKLKPGTAAPEAELSPMDQLQKIQPSAPAKPEVAAPSFGQKLLGAGEAALSAGSGLVAAPISALAGVGKGLIGGKYGTPEGVADAEKFASNVQDKLTYAPRTESGKNQIGGLSKVLEASKLQGLNPSLGAEVGVLAPMAARQAITQAPKVAKSIGAEIGATGRAGVTGRIGNFVEDATGVKVPRAKSEAVDSMKGALNSAINTTTDKVGKLGLREQQLAEVRKKLDAKLEQSQLPNAANNLDSQGGSLREAFTGAIGSAKADRAATADQLFSNVKNLAVEKEKLGARVDTSAIQNSLRNMMSEAQGITDLENGLGKMLTAISGRTPPTGAPQGNIGKTFSQLELTRRYLNDVAFASDVEGYPAIIKSQARATAKGIDEAMSNFIPEFKTYKETYAKMSEPLHSLSTRYGRAISGTEGGLKDNAYSKVANADLPNKLFSRREGIDLMVDALSGGKNSNPTARVAATKQVEKMVENWIIESVRGKSPDAKLKHVNAPQSQGALSALPELAPKVKGVFENEARIADVASKAGKMSESFGKKKIESNGALDKMKMDLQKADDQFALPGGNSKLAAYNGYVNAIGSARRLNYIKREPYRAAMELIDRASTLEEKSALAKRLATKIVLYVGLPALGVGIYEHGMR